MKTSDKIKSLIDRFPRGFVFTCTDFTGKIESASALNKTLNRLVSTGYLSKLSKGRFYKATRSIFGDLEPESYQVVKDLLDQNGAPSGYLTGLSIYNHLGLTTQVGNTIQVGRNDFRPPLTRGRFKISFIKQKNKITKENRASLQVLDAIRFIKKIPDTTEQKSCCRLIEILKGKTEAECHTLIRLSLKYPPSTRAILGAMIQEVGQEEQTENLKLSLNPLTTYAMPKVSEILRYSADWNIK